MKNTELLIKSVDDYDLYPQSTREVLKLLIEINIDGISTITLRKIAMQTNLSTASVRKSIISLQKDDVIELIKTPCIRPIGIFKLKSGKLDKFIEIYEIKNKKLS